MDIFMPLKVKGLASAIFDAIEIYLWLRLHGEAKLYCFPVCFVPESIV